MAKHIKAGLFAPRIAFALAGLVVIMLAVHLFLQYLNLNVYNEQNGFVFELSNRLDLDDEISVPTWLSQILLFIIGLSAFLAAYLQKDKARRWLWSLIGGLGVLLSIDEAASLHELALQTVHNKFFLDTSPTTGENAWWVIAPLIILVGIGLAWQSIRLLPKRTVSLFIIGGFVFLGGAVIIDIVSVGIATNTFMYQGLAVGLEEACELFGSIIVLYAVVDYIETHHRESISKIGYNTAS